MRRHAVKDLVGRIALLLTAAALAEEGDPERARQVAEEAGKGDRAGGAGTRCRSPRAEPTGIALRASGNAPQSP